MSCFVLLKTRTPNDSHENFFANELILFGPGGFIETAQPRPNTAAPQRGMPRLYLHELPCEKSIHPSAQRNEDFLRQIFEKI
jgi:hypothetical protein